MKEYNVDGDEVKLDRIRLEIYGKKLRRIKAKKTTDYFVRNTVIFFF